LVRTHTLLLGAALMLVAGCKDTGSPGSGVPGAVEGSAGGEVRSGVGAAGEEAVPPAATATAADEAAPPPTDSTAKLVECTTRSSTCTREYMPVCGILTS